MPDSTGMINNLKPFTLTSISPHFNVCVFASVSQIIFLKVITHKAGSSQPRKPQRELTGTLSFVKPVPLLEESLSVLWVFRILKGKSKPKQEENAHQK